MKIIKTRLKMGRKKVMKLIYVVPASDMYWVLTTKVTDL